MNYSRLALLNSFFFLLAYSINFKFYLIKSVYLYLIIFLLSLFLILSNRIKVNKYLILTIVIFAISINFLYFFNNNLFTERIENYFIFISIIFYILSFSYEQNHESLRKLMIYSFFIKIIFLIYIIDFSTLFSNDNLRRGFIQNQKNLDYYITINKLFYFLFFYFFLFEIFNFKLRRVYLIILFVLSILLVSRGWIIIFFILLLLELNKKLSLYNLFIIVFLIFLINSMYNFLFIDKNNFNLLRFNTISSDIRFVYLNTLIDCYKSNGIFSLDIKQCFYSIHYGVDLDSTYLSSLSNGIFQFFLLIIYLLFSALLLVNKMKYFIIFLIMLSFNDYSLNYMITLPMIFFIFNLLACKYKLNAFEKI